MKSVLISILLFVSFNLWTQPVLTSDYYFQEGQHEYGFYNVETAILEKEGANVLWDFSSSQQNQNEKLTLIYHLDTLLGNDIYQVLPFYGTVSTDNLEKTDLILTKSNVQGYLDINLLSTDSSINLIKNGNIDCDTGSFSKRKTRKPFKVFPPNLNFRDRIVDSIYFEITSPEKDTILTSNTFVYSGFGSFIHPSGIAICDVIQLKQIKPNHLGELEIATGWYSRETGGPIAMFTRSLDREASHYQVEIKKLEAANISLNDRGRDTLIYKHNTRECGFTINFYPNNSCDGFLVNEIVYIDLWNDGRIDTYTSQKEINFLTYNFEIGTHRIVFEHSLSKEVAEQILVIEDDKAPEIAGYCDGNFYYKGILKDSSGVLITPSDLYVGVKDNNCRDSLVYRFWLSSMEADGIPEPRGWSRAELLSTLPSTYYINCFLEDKQLLTGIIYAFDSAGNWSSNYVYLTIYSGNCVYYCPTETLTKLSIQDIRGNTLDQIVSLEYGKEMERQNSLYLYRVCPADTTTRFDFRKTSSVLENVSSFDLLLIQQHILGLKPFTSFYQFAAADVNFSGDITAFDLLIIKRTILGLNQTFVYGRNWVFYEKLEGLLDLQPNIDVLPLHLLEEKRFTLVDTTYHFLGVKLGDVSN